MGKGRRKLFEIFFILLIINIGLVGVPSAYAGLGAVCGNGVCESSETAETCSKDCVSTCGNGTCDPKTENAETCPKDCSSGPVTCDGTNDGATCDDGNSCTQDTCSAGVCVGKNLAEGTTCDDGNSCTSGDACDSSGVCKPTKTAPDATPCDDGNACTSEEVCKSGVCLGGSPISCDDVNVCTTDSCDPDIGCLNTANSLKCDDGLFCTDGDVCSGGVCKSSTATCTSSETCDESGNECVAGPVCGNSIIEDPETCDGSNLGFADCVSLGFDGGTLACNVTCDGFDTSECTTAGGCTIDTDCATGQVCDTNTATCIQEETQQTSGEVNILETCGLAFVSGNPVGYPPVLPGGISDPEQLLVLDNTGNIVAVLLVQGGDWLDANNVKVMNVGDTKYAIIAVQDYATQKTALTGADVVVTAAFDPVVDQNTYWQLQANLLNNNFAGDLTQTMDFTVTC